VQAFFLLLFFFLSLEEKKPVSLQAYWGRNRKLQLCNYGPILSQGNEYPKMQWEIPGTFYVLRWVIGIRIVHTGSYLANVAQICNKKWTWLQTCERWLVSTRSIVSRRHQHWGSVHVVTRKLHLGQTSEHVHTDRHKYDKKSLLLLLKQIMALFTIYIALFGWFWWYLWPKMAYKKKITVQGISKSGSILELRTTKQSWSNETYTYGMLEHANNNQNSETIGRRFISSALFQDLKRREDCFSRKGLRIQCLSCESVATELPSVRVNSSDIWSAYHLFGFPTFSVLHVNFRIFALVAAKICRHCFGRVWK